MSKPFRLADAKIDDVVKCDVRGRQFFAEVQRRATLVDGTDGLQVKPITHNVSYRHVTALQVRELYRKARPRRARPRKPESPGT